MSGHSKWSTIKHKKEKSDAKKGKIFTKIGREIMVAVKEGGCDPQLNIKLSDAIAKAKSNNMPNDNIERSIKKAAGDINGANFENITYEGYGPSGVAVIVEAMTDNRNRTAADVRHFFDKFDGNLGTTGCVSFLFNKKGIILIEKNKDIVEEDLMMSAIEAGAEDFKDEDEIYEVSTEPKNFSRVRKALENGYKLLSAEITMIPSNYTKLENPKDIETMEKLVDNLEDLDDVQDIYHNWEQDDDG